jgi:hypothetical protein
VAGNGIAIAIIVREASSPGGNFFFAEFSKTRDKALRNIYNSGFHQHSSENPRWFSKVATKN